jgi:hypothetical protein
MEFSVPAHEGFAAIFLPDLIADVPIPEGLVVGKIPIADRGVMRSKGSVHREWMRRFDGKAVLCSDLRNMLIPEHMKNANRSVFTR